MTRQYSFKVTTLLDSEATRDNILHRHHPFPQEPRWANDSFLIYYAGHGSYDRQTEKRLHWLLTDADTGPPDRTSRDISADDLTAEVRGLDARHVLIISDG